MVSPSCLPRGEIRRRFSPAGCRRGGRSRRSPGSSPG